MPKLTSTTERHSWIAILFVSLIAIPSSFETSAAAFSAKSSVGLFCRDARTSRTSSSFLGMSSSSLAASSQSESDVAAASSKDSVDDMSLFFGKFRISSSTIFYRSALSAAFVNLRPIVPGHVLVAPKRLVVRLDELHEDEYLDLWKSVRVVQNMLGQHYMNASAFNVAVQDGRSAGQSVPHVHVHILPRIDGDFELNDKIYDELEEWAPREELAALKPKLEVPDDKDRKDRTKEEMEKEAATYRDLLGC